jgi:hypothetical protein
MRAALLTLAIAGLGITRVSAQTAPASRLAASLVRVFGPVTQVDTIAVPGGTVLRVSRGTAPLGFATVRNVLGKDQPITYLVAVDTTLTLLDVDVLVYREAYGGEVAYEPWRRQFRGKHPGDGLQVGREIRGISGATISVNAVTAGIRGTLADFATWRRAGAL